MKNIFKIVLSFVLFISFGLFVSANSNAILDDGDTSNTNLTSLKNSYNNPTNTTITGTDNNIVKIYGKSICSNNNCTATYGKTNSISEFLASHVICSNGSKKISYTSNIEYGSLSSYIGVTSNVSDGTYYWYIDTIAVKCSESSSASDTNVTLTSNNTSSDSSTNSSSSDSSTSSDDTVDSPTTGVESYYILLAVLVVFSYLSIKLVKKYNLFKNI